MANIITITDFSAPELDIYARLTEAQLMNRFDPSKAMFIAESPKVIERALDAGYEPVSILAEKKHIEGEAKEVIARCDKIPVFTAEFFQKTGFIILYAILNKAKNPIRLKSFLIKMKSFLR